MIGAIDDCSRVIVGARFFFHENSFNLEAVLKEAIIRFGAVKMLYTDYVKLNIITVKTLRLVVPQKWFKGEIQDEIRLLRRCGCGFFVTGAGVRDTRRYYPT